jgi:hypothetical protein
MFAPSISMPLSLDFARLRLRRPGRLAHVDAVVGAHIAERTRTGRVAAGWEGRLFDLFWPTVRA